MAMFHRKSNMSKLSGIDIEPSSLTDLWVAITGDYIRTSFFTTVQKGTILNHRFITDVFMVYRNEDFKDEGTCINHKRQTLK